MGFTQQSLPRTGEAHLYADPALRAWARNAKLVASRTLSLVGTKFTGRAPLSGRHQLGHFQASLTTAGPIRVLPGNHTRSREAFQISQPCCKRCLASVLR